MSKETDDEKRRPLTDEEIEAIKNQLLESIYADIGKSVIKKFLWVAGAVVVGAFTALTAFGHIKLGP